MKMNWAELILVPALFALDCQFHLLIEVGTGKPFILTGVAPLIRGMAWSQAHFGGRLSGTVNTDGKASRIY